ncbi:hypothetical protein WOC76_22315 [Methylocystis sp. IM3]|uniref:hypothetical protein n=1 Tax=unclassified Methylocystis TaxID=2625913 RepID=UPI0030FB0249
MSEDMALIIGCEERDRGIVADSLQGLIDHDETFREQAGIAELNVSQYLLDIQAVERRHISRQVGLAPQFEKDLRDRENVRDELENLSRLFNAAFSERLGLNIRRAFIDIPLRPERRSDLAFDPAPHFQRRAPDLFGGKGKADHAFHPDCPGRRWRSRFSHSLAGDQRRLTSDARQDIGLRRQSDQGNA